MRVGVVGAGSVGTTLARALANVGHDVAIGVRSPEGRSVSGAVVTSIAPAMEGADAVIVAIPGAAVGALLRDYGSLLEDVVAIDAANSLTGDGPLHHADAFSEYAPRALLVRAFNTLGWENFANPSFDGERPDHYWCAEPGRPTEVAERIIADVGLRPVRVGGLEEIETVDGVLRLWFALVKGHGGERHMAFKTLGL